MHIATPSKPKNVSVSGTMMSVWDVWVGVSYMSTQQKNLNLFNPQKPPRFFKIWREMWMKQKQHIKKNTVRAHK